MDILHLGILFYIYPVNTSVRNCLIITYGFVLICLWILYLWLLIYVCVLHKVWSLVALHIGASCHAYSLFIIGYSVVVILVDLNSQKLIDISLFELVFIFIEAHIFVPSCSISYIFISIIKFFCFSSLLGQLFNWTLQHKKNTYNIISILSLRKYNVFRVSYLATCGSNASH